MKKTLFLLLLAGLMAPIGVPSALAQDESAQAEPAPAPAPKATGLRIPGTSLSKEDVLAFARQIATAPKENTRAQIDLLSLLVRSRGVRWELTAADEAEINTILGNARGKNYDLFDQMRLNYPGPKVEVGERVSVDWKGMWFDAEILKVSDEAIKVHYIGWGETFDEIVEPNRVLRIIPGFQAQGLLERGSQVQAEGTGRWAEAEIVAITGESYKVHFAGRSSFFDKTVPIEKIRKAVRLYIPETAAERPKF